MWKRTGAAPVTVKLPAGVQGGQIVLRVSRPDAALRASFELVTGMADPYSICVAVEERIGGNCVNVMNVEREATRTVSKVTLVGSTLPAILLKEPWVELDGERKLLRFKGGPTTCDRCWSSGHPRQLCPSTPPPAIQECTRCSQKGHLADACWLATAQCHYCYETGHFRANCPALICFSCSKSGHLARACPSARKQEVEKTEGGNGAQKGHKRNKVKSNGGVASAPVKDSRGRLKGRATAPVAHPRPEARSNQGAGGTVEYPGIDVQRGQSAGARTSTVHTSTGDEPLVEEPTKAHNLTARTPSASMPAAVQSVGDRDSPVRTPQATGAAALPAQQINVADSDSNSYSMSESSYDNSSNDGDSEGEDEDEKPSQNTQPVITHISPALATIQAVFNDLGLPTRKIHVTPKGEYYLDRRGPKSAKAQESRTTGEAALAAICSIIEAGGSREAAERAAWTAIKQIETTTPHLRRPCCPSSHLRLHRSATASLRYSGTVLRLRSSQRLIRRLKRST